MPFFLALSAFLYFIFLSCSGFCFVMAYGY